MISSNDITALCNDSSGNMWVGTMAGIMCYKSNRKLPRTFTHDSDDPGSLAGDNVFSIFQDFSGIVWIGAGALNKYVPKLEHFGHFRHELKKEHTLSQDKVTCFMETHQGILYVGTENRGFNKFDDSTGLLNWLMTSI